MRKRRMDPAAPEAGARTYRSRVGTTCVPDGPCLTPVLPGLMVPSGVLMIGAALLAS